MIDEIILLFLFCGIIIFIFMWNLFIFKNIDVYMRFLFFF